MASNSIGTRSRSRIHGASTVEGIECTCDTAATDFQLACDMVIPAIGQSRLVEFCEAARRRLDRRPRRDESRNRPDRESEIFRRRRLRQRRPRSGGRRRRRQARRARHREICSALAWTMADLTTLFAGKIRCPNPFWLASGPPANCGDQVMRAFDAGWGGAVWKTLGEPITNVSSRYSLGRLERPAHDGPEQHRADHGPSARSEPARDLRGEEALSAIMP